MVTMQAAAAADAHRHTVRSLPACHAATSPCASATRPGGARCAPGSRGSATSWTCRPDLPPDVLAEAEESAREAGLPAEDLTDLPFLTIDPPGSTDLDQAMHLERRAAATGALRDR